MAKDKVLTSMSFHDLMEGVGRGHKALAAVPGAQRIPGAARQIRPNEMPLEVLQRMADQGLFKTQQGEVIKPQVRAKAHPLQKTEEAQRAMNRGEMPLAGTIEFKTPGNTFLGEIDFRSKPASQFADNPGQTAMFEQMGATMGRPVRAYGLDTSIMPKGMGREGYAAILDMIRAGGDINVIDTLTGVNQMRRPGNIMSYGLAHGDYRGVPLFPGFTNIDPLPFAGTGVGGPPRFNAEEEAIRRLVLERGGRDTAQALDARTAERYSDDAKTGLLALKEMAMAKAHGSMDPADLGGEFGKHFVFREANPMDPDQLRYYADKMRKSGTGASINDSFGPHRGFGTGLIGRVGTTEALLGGLQTGATTEEIIEQLLRYKGAEEALQGRYAKGGLASAAIEG